MRIRTLATKSAGLVMLFVASAIAAPIPISLIGVGKSVHVESSEQYILGGGSFNAQVGNPALPGVSTLFWCIDAENYINYGDTFLANIILVSDTAANPTLVRKGAETSWEDGQGYTAQQRFTAAAYLVEMLIAGGSGFSAGEIQRAIWRLTDAADIKDDTQPDFENEAYAVAQAFIGNNGTPNGVWASVSGIAGAGGVLSSTARRQTFLVQVDPGRDIQSTVPEPGAFALVGGGLLLLGWLRRRR